MCLMDIRGSQVQVLALSAYIWIQSVLGYFIYLFIIINFLSGNIVELTVFKTD